MCFSGKVIVSRQIEIYVGLLLLVKGYWHSRIWRREGFYRMAAFGPSSGAPIFKLLCPWKISDYYLVLST
jgi:hypothetical protein